MTIKQQPITCQEILKDTKRLFPNKHAKVIAENSTGISLRRVYGVYSGVITDPQKIMEVATAAREVIRKIINPDYAKDSEIVFKK